MSLRKSPTLTPALLAANRRNSQKSTGPRTVRGKAQTRMNALRTGERSRLRRNLLLTLLNAPPGRVEAWAESLMMPEMALNQQLRETAEIVIQAEREAGQCYHELVSRRKGKSGGKVFPQQSRNVIEKMDRAPGKSRDVVENAKVVVYLPRCL